MGAIIFAAILFLIAIAGILYAIFSTESRIYGAIAGVTAGIVGILTLLFASVQTVGTSDVGVETAYGKTVGDLPPGLHMIPPWVNVTTWDGSVQTISYGRDNCLQVRIGGQQSACITLTFQYQVLPRSADSLFKQYRTQQNMNDKLVLRSLDQAVNEQLATFSPIEAVAGGNPNGASLVPFAKLVAAQVNSEIGNDIKVGAVFMPYATYDPSTTGRLNALQTQVADTLIAQQAVKTSQAQKQANDTLAQSVTNANVIAQQCVTNVLVPLTKAGINPAGISCWPGSGGSTVVVPAK